METKEGLQACGVLHRRQKNQICSILAINGRSVQVKSYLRFEITCQCLNGDLNNTVIYIQSYYKRYSTRDGEILPGCRVSLPVRSTFFGQNADLTSGLQCISCHPVTLLVVTRQNTVDVDLTPDFGGDNGLFGNSCGAGWCCQTIRVYLQNLALDNNWLINKWGESNCYTYNIFQKLRTKLLQT